jgi:hypothetical protein
MEIAPSDIQLQHAAEMIRPLPSDRPALQRFFRPMLDSMPPRFAWPANIQLKRRIRAAFTGGFFWR